MNNSQGQPKTPSQQEFMEFLFYFHEMSGGHCPVITKKKDGGFQVEPDPAQRTIKDKWLDIIPNELMSGAEKENLIKTRICSKHSQWNNSHIISLTRKGMDKFLSTPENHTAFGKPSFVPNESLPNFLEGDDLEKDENDIIFDAVLNEEEGLLDAIQEFGEQDNNDRKRSRKAGDASLILWKLLIEKSPTEKSNKVPILNIWMRASCPISTISSKQPSWHPQHLIRLDFKNIQTTDLNEWLKQETYFKRTIKDIISAQRHFNAHSKPFLNKTNLKIKDDVDTMELLELPENGNLTASKSDHFIMGIARYILWWLWRIRVVKSQEPHFSSLVQTYQP